MLILRSVAVSDTFHGTNMRIDDRYVLLDWYTTTKSIETFCIGRT